MSKQFIYLYATDGLCNRMRAIDSAISLSSELNRPLRVIWNKNKLLNSSFKQLFTPIPDVEVVEISNTILPGINFNRYPKNSPFASSTFSSIARRLIWKGMMMSRNIKGEIYYNDLLDIHIRNSSNGLNEAWENETYRLVEERVKQSIHEKYSNFIVSCWRLCPNKEWYKGFQPVTELQTRIDKISEQFDKTIGLHIRRTDHASAILNSGLDKFIKRLEQEIDYDSQTTFFLATDDATTEEFLVNRFGDRIMVNHGKLFSRSIESGIQDAVVDLYALSRTSKILGSYSSSFSQVAADISRIECEVIT